MLQILLCIQVKIVQILKRECRTRPTREFDTRQKPKILGISSFFLNIDTKSISWNTVKFFGRFVA